MATQTAMPGDAAGPGAAGKPKLIPKPEEIAGSFPQLEILECLGRGGMGVVYKARQKSLNRLVALKILAPEREQDAAFARRFALEAETLAKLDHPNIVAVHDFGQAGSLFYLVMEFVDGINLQQLIHGDRLAPREALAIVPQICDALQYAHDHGVVHRDIKPENILLDRQGHVKVADFGLAKLVGTSEAPADQAGAISPAATGVGTVMGTPQYMAPEQRERPTKVDHRADIYSLGVVFYQMLTGELPAAGKIEAPSRKVIVDVRLDEVVLRALEREPERRYQQASRVKQDVETIASASSAAQSAGAREHPTASTTEIEKSFRAIKTPAIGLIVSGLVNLLPLIAAIVSTASHGGLVLAVVPFVLMAASGGVVVLGALRMLRLQAYPFAVAVSILAMITPPGFLLGLPFGFWALLVLTRNNVRDAFRNPAPSEPKSASSAPDRTTSRAAGWKPILGLLAILLLGALAIGGFVLMRGRATSDTDARIAAVNQRLTGEVRHQLDGAGFGYREVEVAVYSPGFPGGRCGIIGLRRDHTEDAHSFATELNGGLNVRHDGSGTWFFNGWGALSNMQFQVDAAYEMGLSQSLRREAQKESAPLYPIHAAVRRGEQQAVATYLETGSPADSLNDEGQTPLHVAAAHGHRELAAFLLAKGADIYAKDQTGRTPLALALANNHSEMAAFLAARGADKPLPLTAAPGTSSIAEEDKYPLHTAAIAGHKSAVARLIENGAPVDSRNDKGQTLLHLAAAYGHRDLAGFLLEKGAAIDATDKQGRTALAEAMANCHDSMTAFLISKGADPVLAGRALCAAPDSAPAVALSLKIKTLSDFDRECKEPGVLLDSPRVCFFAPKRKAAEAKIVFPYLVSAYDELHRITGIHTFNKVVVYAFPRGNPNVTGGTSGPDSIEYDESSLDLAAQEEWKQHQVPHVSGIIEEMAHCFVTASRAKFGWEMLGWSLGVEASSKVANNPKFASDLVSTREEQEKTFARYLAGGCRFPDELPGNVCDRIHAWVLYDSARGYGQSFWPDFYSQLRRQRDALFKTAREEGSDNGRNARCRITIGCFDQLPGVHFSERLRKAGISVTTDVKSLKPEAAGWNRRLGP